MNLKLNVIPKRYIVTVQCADQKTPFTINLEAESVEKAKLSALSCCEQEGVTNAEIISCEED